MDLLQLYYCAGIPILTCNMLFYSLTSLSTSITSSQNVFKFIYEHKNSDFSIYKNEIETLDLQNKLKIVHSLIFDILKKYCSDNNEYELLLDEIKNPIILTKDLEEEQDFSMIEIKSESTILQKIDTPVIYALMSTLETIENIYLIMNIIKEKIIIHRKSYLKNITTLCLKNELSNLKKYSHLFDIRVNLLLEILKIYTPFILIKNNM